MEAISDTKFNKLKISKTLYVFAWIIEACAVATGLLISILVGISTYRQNKLIDESGGVTDFTNVLIAALPFFMIAIVELTKIPMAQAMYATTHFFWKSIFGLALIFLAFITFETALNGFERNFTSLNYQVTQLVNEKETLIERYEFLKKQNQRDKELTREDVLGEFARQNQNLIGKRDKDFSLLSTKESEIQTKTNNVQISAIKEKISDYKSQKESLINQQRQEVSTIQADLSARSERLQSDAQNKKTDLQLQIQKEESRLRNLRDNFSSALKKANFFTRGGVRERYEPKIESQERKVDSLNQRLLNYSVHEEISASIGSNSENIQAIIGRYADRIETINKKIEKENIELTKIAGITQNDLKRDRASLNDDRKRTQKQYESDLKILQQRKAEDLQNVKNRESRISNNQKIMRELDERLSDARAKINEQVKDNQIYRLAKMFDTKAKTIADVDIAFVNWVAKVWFGSLAAVIAITGIILALASEVIKDDRSTQLSSFGRTRPPGSTLRSLALAINRWKRRTTQIKMEIREVIKEVPVNKVVFNEVVKEVIKKEVVHVPIYTNDPNLLRGQDVSN